jgi:hypothetical protein
VTITDYAACQTCRARVIWPIDKHGVKLAPVNWGPDPAGTVAVQHLATGAWLGRVIEQGGPAPVFPEKRFRWHRETCATVDGER